MECVAEVQRFVEDELAGMQDRTLRERLSQLLVDPYPVEREWDYGADGQKFTCWTVAEHRESNTGIAFCSQGFGPASPWGLAFLSGPHMSIGMDCGWYQSLENAFRESMAWDEPVPPGHVSE